MAVERFIMVVLPFKAKSILTTKYYTLSSAVVISITTFMTTAGAIGFFQDWDFCGEEGYITNATISQQFCRPNKYIHKPIVPSKFLKSWNKQNIEYRRGEQHDSAEGKKAKNPKIETLLYLSF